MEATSAAAFSSETVGPGCLLAFLGLSHQLLSLSHSPVSLGNRIFNSTAVFKLHATVMTNQIVEPIVIFNSVIHATVVVVLVVLLANM